jgi:starch synthase (maltosyl-transferring)
MRQRVIIHSVTPEIEGGRSYIKRVPGEQVDVSCTAFGDGHDYIRVALRYKHFDDKDWATINMTQGIEPDIWFASFQVTKEGFYKYEIEGWVDQLLHWHEGFKKKVADGQDMKVELEIGAAFLEKAAKGYDKKVAAVLNTLAKGLTNKKRYAEAVEEVLSEAFAKTLHAYPLLQFVTTYDENLRVRVGRQKELFSAWYELFPRAASPNPKRSGTFKDVEKLLPRVAELGFDVLYMPPIHPVGELNRKGKNNNVNAEKGEPGSPWAIGSKHGGHKAVNPELGTLTDYKRLIRKAKKDHDIEIALDLAYQCAPDHPWIKEHPSWFVWRPDGTIAYAENPPKKYQDIVPINFESEDWENLWDALLDIVLFWNKQGIKIFRVDNPHTKAFRFWEWLIAKAQEQDPDIIFLAEAFTRPAVMLELAKIGYTQSYSYFVWRKNPYEMRQYMEQLCESPLREVMRPNFWPNTPDILPHELMGEGYGMFMLRLGLAATLSSNYGLYGPAYEFMENEGADTGKDEYHNSEKYEVRHYDWKKRNRLTDFMTRLNKVRKAHAALQTTYNITFSDTSNSVLQSYVKVSGESRIWCIVNWDGRGVQTGHVQTPWQALGLESGTTLLCKDLLTGETYIWRNEWNFVALDPARWPMHILEVTVAPRVP